MTVAKEALAGMKKALESGEGVRVAIDINPNGECEIVVMERESALRATGSEPLFQKRVPYAEVASMLPLMLSYLA